MKSVLQRLLMFIIGLPLVVLLVVFLPYKDHLAANCIVVLMSALGALEFSRFLNKHGYPIKTLESLLLGALLPFAALLQISMDFPDHLVFVAITLGAAWIISSRVFSPINDISKVIERSVAGLAILLYPGAFLVWIIFMAEQANANILMMIFLLMVFANDSMAWLFGMLFGAGNRGFIPASPNKSIVGFVAGLSSSIAIGLLSVKLFPEAMSLFKMNSYISALLIGLSTGIAAIIGDLAESTLKRSAEVKDSGTIMPGRGGILDSIDSVSFAAPVFFIVYYVLSV